MWLNATVITQQQDVLIYHALGLTQTIMVFRLILYESIRKFMYKDACFRIGIMRYKFTDTFVKIEPETP